MTWVKTTYGEVEVGDEIFDETRGDLRATVTKVETNPDYPNGVRVTIEATLSFIDAFNWPVEVFRRET